MNPRLSARDEIMTAIRDGLAASAAIEAKNPLHPAAPPPSTPRPAPVGPPTLPLAAFRARMEAVGGRVAEVVDEAEATALIAAILAELGARTLAVTDSPLARSIGDSLGASGAAETITDASTEQLFECDAGLTEAQWAIAETGTLVLASAHERNRLASLAPPIHFALLRAGSVCDTIGDALTATRAADGGIPSHVITFITGPSRTSDIELTLAIGVHGPQHLIVIVLP